MSQITENKKTVNEGKNVVAPVLTTDRFVNGVNIAVAHYSFADDGGAVGAIPLTLDRYIPAGSFVYANLQSVTTPYTSGGAATISFGVVAAADLRAALAFDNNANLTQSYVEATNAGAKAPLLVATADNAVIMTVAGAALTAGIMDFYVFYIPPAPSA